MHDSMLSVNFEMKMKQQLKHFEQFIIKESKYFPLKLLSDLHFLLRYQMIICQHFYFIDKPKLAIVVILFQNSKTQLIGALRYLSARQHQSQYFNLLDQLILILTNYCTTISLQL